MAEDHWPETHLALCRKVSSLFTIPCAPLRDDPDGEMCGKKTGLNKVNAESSGLQARQQSQKMFHEADMPRKPHRRRMYLRWATGGLPLVITMSGELQNIPNPWDGDSWSNWDPDPERAFREHDPTLEPYASMSKEELLECMRNAHGGREWEFLREFLLDKCTE